MAVARIPTKRGAFYMIGESTSPGTYVAPTQNSDKALRPIAMSIEPRGGYVDQNDDVSPAVGGSDPIRDAMGWRYNHAYRVPVWPDLTSIASHPLDDVLNSTAGALSLLTTPNRVRYTPTNRFVPGVIPLTISPTHVQLDGNTYTAAGGVSALTRIRTEGQAYLVFEFVSDCQNRTADADNVVATSAGSLTTAAAEYVSESYVNPKGRTLTLTNVDGSAVICADSFAIETGMALTDATCGSAGNGFGISGTSFNGSCILSISVFQLPELATSDGRQFWESLYAGEDLGATSIVCGSGASAFTISTTKAKIMNITPKDINGFAGYDIAIKFLSSTPAALDHLLLTWGA